MRACLAQQPRPGAEGAAHESEPVHTKTSRSTALKKRTTTTVTTRDLPVNARACLLAQTLWPDLLGHRTLVGRDAGRH